MTRLLGRVVRLLIRGVLPLVVIGGGLYGAIKLIETAPQAKQRPTQRNAVLVSTQPVAPTRAPVVIEAMGTVVPARQITLQPQVSGRITAVHPSFEPGGVIEPNEVLVAIEDADYRVAVAQAQANVDRAQAELVSAEQELDRLENLRRQRAVNQKELDDARAMRNVTFAAKQAAQAALDQAELNLARTQIRAPFRCLVISESVDVGAQVTPQTQIATLVGTDKYWVRVALPVDKLRWVRMPGEADTDPSPVTVRQRLDEGATATWQGQVERLVGELEPQGRMARLLVAVPRPLGGEGASNDDTQPPLLIGAYVEVAIEGRALRDVFVLDRSHVREGRHVWLMDPNDTLELRPVEIVFGGREQVYVRDGLTPGERLVISDLPAPVAGMPLRENGIGAHESKPAVTAVENAATEAAQ